MNGFCQGLNTSSLTTPLFFFFYNTTLKGEVTEVQINITFLQVSSSWGLFCVCVCVTYLPDEGFPGGSEGKASACNVGDLGSVPGSGRSPGEGNGNPL